MVAIPADQSAQVRVVLGEIVAEHGRSALSDPARMSNLLKDLLPDAVGVARMLVAAAEDRVADELRDHAASGLDGTTAARLVTSSFAGRTLFAPEACAFIVGQIALALGIIGEIGYAPTVVSPSHEPAGSAGRSSDSPAGRPPAEPPRLALPSDTIDFGQIAQHGPSPERRVRIGNAGGGSLNARAVASETWIIMRHHGEELVITADTGTAGQRQGVVTIESNGGSAAIRIRATIRPETARPEPAATAASVPGAVNLSVVHNQPAEPEQQSAEQEHWPWPWAPDAKRRAARPR